MTIKFLSPEWFAAANETLSTLAGVPEAVAIGYEVQYPTRTVSWALVADADGLRLEPGQQAPVVFAMSESVAAAISSGRASAQRSFLAGRVELKGDPSAVVNAASAVAVADGALLALRGQTIYGSETG